MLIGGASFQRVVFIPGNMRRLLIIYLLICKMILIFWKLILSAADYWSADWRIG